ncbi:MAG: FtsX-like permease family protein [Paludibaculum sp.]
MYLAAQREREIGVRLALGATPAQILKMILAHAFRWTAAGLTAGIVGAAAAAYALKGLLFHIQPADPVAFASAALSLAIIALLGLAPALPPGVRGGPHDDAAAGLSSMNRGPCLFQYLRRFVRYTLPLVGYIAINTFNGVHILHFPD